MIVGRPSATLLIPPPPTPRDPSSFTCPFPNHLCCCLLAHGHKGVFHYTFFDINYWQNFLLKTLFHLHSFFGVTFCTFSQHFFAEKCTPLLPNENFKNSLFSAFHYCIYPLLNPCHANYLCLRNKTPLQWGRWEGI